MEPSNRYLCILRSSILNGLVRHPKILAKFSTQFPYKDEGNINEDSRLIGYAANQLIAMKFLVRRLKYPSSDLSSIFWRVKVLKPLKN